MPAPPRVLVVDDHPIVLEGVRNALAPLPATVEVAIDPETAISMLEEREFDLAILDISFRNSNLTGYDILRSCRRAHPHLPVLMASVFDDEWIQDAAWREGASGFISKGKADSVWREAARALLGGGTSFHFLPRKKARSQGLTPTELEVAHLLADGLTEEEAAEKMVVTSSAVQKHVRELKDRMASRNGLHLIRDFFLRGLHLLPRPARPPPAQRGRRGV